MGYFIYMRLKHHETFGLGFFVCMDLESIEMIEKLLCLV